MAATGLGSQSAFIVSRAFAAVDGNDQSPALEVVVVELSHVVVPQEWAEHISE